MKHLVSCGKHSELELLHGYTRRTPDPAPDLYPRLILICILSNSLLAAKRGSLFTYPSQGTGSHGQTPPRAGDPSGQGSAHRNRAQSPCCRAPPALFLGRAGSEHLRAGFGLTAAPGQVGDPGLHSVWPPSTRSSRGFHCTRTLGPCLHPLPLFFLTPGSLSLGESLLEILSRSWARKND